MKLKSIFIKVLIYGYLFLPILIFVVGWLKIAIALPVACILLISFCFAVKSDKRDYTSIIKVNTIQKFVCVAMIICVWVILSGIGNMSFQNGDFNARRSIFRALLEYDWPVVSQDGERLLIYYIGYWLPSAVVGKIFGYKMGTIFTAIWACMGIFICYYLICLYKNKVSIKYMIIFIFFSGLDYIGIFLLNKPGINVISVEHLEWWSSYFQYSSMTTQLFWVFNQAIPAWIATMLILLNRENTENHYFILACILITSTFPFVGLIPIVLTFSIEQIAKCKRVKPILSFQNIVAVLIIGIISVGYLISNLSAGNVEASTTQSNAPIITYILFYFLEFGIYCIMIYRTKRKDVLFYVVVGILLACPFVKVGSAADFCMRASIPALFILMVFCIDALDTFKEQNMRIDLWLLIVFLIIGGKTAFNEIQRSIQCTINLASQGLPYLCEEARIEEDLLQTNNFSGSTEGNKFFEYFMK